MNDFESKSSRFFVRTLIAILSLIPILFLLSGQLFSQAAQAPQPNAPTLIDFDRQVHAIIADHCLTCHSSEKRSGGLSMETYDDMMAGGRSGAVVNPGHGADSLIIQHLTGTVQPQMPFGLDPLGTNEIATIRSWIDQGARRTPTSAVAKAKWVPPLALTAPHVPDSPWKAWSDPIDRFTASYLAKQGVTEPTLISDTDFARRAYLDIWGLLPDPDQLRRFVADKRTDKRKQLVATLLADNTKYTDNWISYWDDLLRNDEGVIYHSETAERKTITPWLLNALKTNEPYNSWISQLLNPTRASDPEGFLIGVNWRGTVSASQTPPLQAAQNSAQIFLGINLKCNSCHDSFISRWKLKDAYGIAAYFSTEQQLQLYRCDIAQEGQFVSAAYLYPELNRPLPSTSAADRRATIAAIFTDPRNGRMPRTLVNRIWQKLMGHGLVPDVDDLDGEPWSPELLDWMASDFVASGYDIKHLIANIVTSRTYQLPVVPDTGKASKQFVFRGPDERRLTAEEFADAVAAITGDWHVSTAGDAGGSGNAGGSAANAAAPLNLSGAPVDGSDLVVRSNPGRGGATAQAGAGAGERGVQPAAVPVQAPLPVPAGEYVRDWRMANDNLTRAMSRPIRDQVFSTRDQEATTVQALELTNGETLNHWLWRGSRRMLGELPPDPKILFSREVTASRGGEPVPFDIDVSKSQKIYLIVRDFESTSPDKGAPLWLHASFTGPDGATTLLTALKPESTVGLRDVDTRIIPAGLKDPMPATEALRVELTSLLVYDIAGKGFMRFRGAPALENVRLEQGEVVTGRFFVFDQKPSMDHLAPPKPGTPLPPGPTLTTIPQVVDRVYWYALGRAPTPAERRIAEDALRDPSHPGRPSADGLADLLWSILMVPEFQYIR